MKMRKAATDAVMNGIVVGALVAGVMILSNKYSALVIARVTLALTLVRFSFYMIENSEDVNAGMVGKYLGLPSSDENQRRLTQFFKAHKFAKLI